MRRNRKRAAGTAITILTAILILSGDLFLGMPRVQAASDEERLLEGLSEDEKQQFLDEIYRDMSEDRPDGEPTSGTLNDSGSGTLNDQEAEKAIRDMLPDQETLEGFAQEAQTRVAEIPELRRGYERERALYQYTFVKDGGGIAISVPLGGWSNQAVTLMPEGNAHLISIYREGEILDQQPGEDGAYVLRDTGRYEFLLNGESGEKNLTGTFRIVSPQIPVRESHLWAPEGYRVSRVMRKGEEIPVEEDRWLTLGDDGLYEVTFTARGETVLPDTWSVVFVRDTTAPAIEWEGEIRDGRFLGSVYFTVDDPEAVISIWHNGRPAVTGTGAIAAPGSYYVTATDPSGNMRSWQFVVEHQDEFPWKIALGAAGIILLSLIVMMVTGRLGMRIR